MKTTSIVLAAGVLALVVATPSVAQESVNPLGLDADPTHAFSPPPPPPPAPDYYLPVHHHRHHHHH